MPSFKFENTPKFCVENDVFIGNKDTTLIVPKACLGLFCSISLPALLIEARSDETWALRNVSGSVPVPAMGGKTILAIVPLEEFTDWE